jgi:hypothetical protein
MGGESTDFLKKGEKTVKGGEESTNPTESNHIIILWKGGILCGSYVSELSS